MTGACKSDSEEKDVILASCAVASKREKRNHDNSESPLKFTELANIMDDLLV